MSDTLFDLPSAPVDDRTASLLALVAGDPIHHDDRRRVIDAILDTARTDGGRVDPNRLRAALTDRHGQSLVYPPVIGAVVAALRHRGVLTEIGWTATTGSNSGNNGRPARVHRLNANRL